MKKFLVTILALTFIMGMSGATFAQASDELTDQSSVPITKLFKLTNEGTISPAETFNFTITKHDVSDSQYTLDTMPMFNPAAFSISFAEGEAISNIYNLTLPEYKHVGVFTYKITETPGNTAGVTYDGRTLYLTVTVINNGDSLIRQVTSLYYLDNNNVKQKAQNFENVFSAGDLAITKEVTGNLGEKDRYFKVTVTLTAPEGKNVLGAVGVSGGSNVNNPTVINFSKTATVDFYLKHGETITLSNIPYGVTYTAVEENVTGDGYKAADYVFSDPNNTIDTAADTVTITNNKDKEVATGISLDNLPYIMILVIAAGGLIIFAKRKRIN